MTYEYRIKKTTERSGNELYIPERRKVTNWFSFLYSWGNVYGLSYSPSKYEFKERAQADIDLAKELIIERKNRDIISTSYIDKL